MEHLGTHPQGFAEALGAMGHDHEFLEIQAVGGVGAAIDHIHQRHRQQVRQRTTQIAVERQVDGVGGGVRVGQAHRQDGVRPQSTLVIASIELVHGRIHGGLVEGAEAAEGWGDPLLDVLHGLLHAFAEVFVVAIAQFVGLVGACAGAAGHDRPAAGSPLQIQHRLHRGGAAGVEHLAGHDRIDHEVEGVVHRG